MGENILGMFENQRSTFARIFGNLKLISSDAKFSDLTTNKIIDRIKSDKKLIYGLGLLMLVLILTAYYLLKF